MRNLPVDLKLGILLCEHLGEKFELIGVNHLLLIGPLQQTARWQLVSARGDFRHGGLRLVIAVGTLGYFNVEGSRQRLGLNSARHRGRSRLHISWIRIKHALDASPARFRRDSRLHGRLGDCRLSRRDQLSLYLRLGDATLVQFLLLTPFGAIFLPILEAIPQGGYEGKAGWKPELDAGKRKRGREIEGDCEHAGANDVGSRKIEVMDQHVAYDSPEQALDRHDVQPAHIARQQRQQRWNKHHQPYSSEALGDRRLNLARGKPANAKHEGKDRQ